MTDVPIRDAEDMSDQPTCELCGDPMPRGEEMFKFHGYSGPCPVQPKPPAYRLDPRDDEIASLRHQLTEARAIREGLRDMLGKCGGWVLTRIEANIDEHGECSKCWMQSGTNPECSACRWVADAESFHKSIVDLLRSTPPTETQEPTR